jgi:hypothetical protein
MKAEESAKGIHAPADDPRSRAELLEIVQRQQRELAVLASIVAAKNNAAIVTEAPVPEPQVQQAPSPEPQVYEAPSPEPQIASYMSLSRQLASLGRTDTKRVLRRLRFLK